MGRKNSLVAVTTASVKRAALLHCDQTTVRCRTNTADRERCTILHVVVVHLLIWRLGSKAPMSTAGVEKWQLPSLKVLPLAINGLPSSCLPHLRGVGTFLLVQTLETFVKVVFTGVATAAIQQGDAEPVLSSRELHIAVFGNDAFGKLSIDAALNVAFASGATHLGENEVLLLPKTCFEGTVNVFAGVEVDRRPDSLRNSAGSGGGSNLAQQRSSLESTGSFKERKKTSSEESLGKRSHEVGVS
mmetsp:Transcript_19660/g.27577  ORF Transcript_19660/g.27577 Transcript_19660/m.27577 type:complete len:244 (-) Transcript_19660:57-788(-)